MRIITPVQTVERNAKIGRYAVTGGLVLLLVAFGVNLLALGQPDNPQMVMYAFGAFIAGFTLTNIGTVFNNRWGRRADLGLADALKGLDDRYTLYNHRLGAQHVLVGPSGVTVLVPKYQAGLITFDDNKWRNPGAPRGFFGLFARDPLGNPTAEAGAEVNSLNSFLKKRAPDAEIAPEALIVFMHSGAEVSAKQAPVRALHVKKLKDHVRRQAKDRALTASALTELQQKLGFDDDEASP